MGDVLDALDDKLIDWIGEQHVFFVATAPADGGHVNLSPEGPRRAAGARRRDVAYLDLTGSGAETIAHTRENGRMTIMFCAFEGPPRILRLYGAGPGPPARIAAVRGAGRRGSSRSSAPASIVELAIERVQTSCGYSIPFMDYREERPTLQQWAARKGDDGLREYWAEKNAESIDGLPALDPTIVQPYGCATVGAMRPRLGVNLVGATRPAGWTGAAGSRRSGFDEISVADHLVDRRRSRPLVALAAAAAVTERVTLSTMVLNNELRHPAGWPPRPPRSQAISGGRFTLGMGAGLRRGRARRHRRCRSRRSRERIDRLEESVVALRAPAARRGGHHRRADHYRFTDHRVSPVPAHAGADPRRRREPAPARGRRPPRRRRRLHRVLGRGDAGTTPHPLHRRRASTERLGARARRCPGDRRDRCASRRSCSR